jgi:hypothetical protein
MVVSQWNCDGENFIEPISFDKLAALDLFVRWLQTIA